MRRAVSVIASYKFQNSVDSLIPNNKKCHCSTRKIIKLERFSQLLLSLSAWFLGSGSQTNPCTRGISFSGNVFSSSKQDFQSTT